MVRVCAYSLLNTQHASADPENLSAVIKGVTIYRYIGICGIILPIRYTGTLNENTGISLYHSSPAFYTRTACLTGCLTYINR